MIVKRTFSKAILNHRCLQKDKADLLVLFMMDNHHKAFQVPLFNIVCRPNCGER